MSSAEAGPAAQRSPVREKASSSSGKKAGTEGVTSYEKGEEAPTKEFRSRWRWRSAMAVLCVVVVVRVEAEGSWRALGEQSSSFRRTHSREKSSGEMFDSPPKRPHLVGTSGRRRPPKKRTTRHRVAVRRWAKKYIERHDRRYRLGHVVRMHASGMHGIANGVIHKLSARLRGTQTKRFDPLQAEAKAFAKLEKARDRAARQYYGWLAWRCMVPVWTACLVTLVGYMGLLLEERTLPAIKQVCAAARIDDDVAGATVLALATGGFEVLFSAVETLEGEVGVGLNFVLGSGVVNFGLILPVVAKASNGPCIHLHLGSVLRDGGFALLAFAVLLVVVEDGAVSLGESLLLLGLYCAHVASCALSPRFFRALGCADPAQGRAQGRARVRPRLLTDDDDDDDDPADDLGRPTRDPTLTTTTGEAPRRPGPAWIADLTVDPHRARPPSSRVRAWFPRLVENLLSPRADSAEQRWIAGALALARRCLPPAVQPPRGADRDDDDDEKKPRPKQLPQVHSGSVAAAIRAAAPTLLGSAAWLVGLLLVLTRLADLLALSSRLPLGFAASVFLPTIYAFPDLLVSAAVARRGQARAAVANALGVQVVTVLLGVGLPFALAILRAKGRPVAVLGSQSDVALRWCVFGLGALFVALVLAEPAADACRRHAAASLGGAGFSAPAVSPLSLGSTSAEALLPLQQPAPPVNWWWSPRFTRHAAATLFLAYLAVTLLVTVRTI